MVLKGRSTIPPAPVEYVVAWNGTMDRQGTCFELTGRIQRQDGTEKARWGRGAPRHPHDRRTETYAKARADVSRLYGDTR